MAAVGGHHGRVDRLLQAAVAEPGGELPELLHSEPGTLAALFVPEAAVPEDGVVAPRHDLLDHEPRSRRGAGGKRCQELVGTDDNQHLAVPICGRPIYDVYGFEMTGYARPGESDASSPTSSG